MTPAEEVMRAFDDLVRDGKVLYIGISDAPAWWIAQANTLAQLRGWTQFIGLQIEYSLIERTVERELIPMAKAFNIGLVAWSPLAGGLLSGKYHSGNGADGRYSTDMAKAFMPTGERPDRVVAALKKVSQQLGRSPAQVALAWLRYRDIPVIPIVGARSVAQLEDNLAGFQLQLTPEQVAVLDQASAIEMGFPHDFFENEMVNTMRYGGLRDQILAA
jgi:aryl-alcohol dehydrogenase-like predicted oxidoreductase